MYSSMRQDKRRSASASVKSICHFKSRCMHMYLNRHSCIPEDPPPFLFAPPRRHDNRRQDTSCTGTRFTCVTSTKVQILTQKDAQRRRGLQTIQRAIKAADGYREFDENEQLKVIARNNLQSDCLYFGRILKEEVEVLSLLVLLVQKHRY